MQDKSKYHPEWWQADKLTGTHDDRRRAYRRLYFKKDFAVPFPSKWSRQAYWGYSAKPDD
jgi:hypothetical protein